jgi:hypothetical protein
MSAGTFRRPAMSAPCLLPGVNRTRPEACAKSRFDPERTSRASEAPANAALPEGDPFHT